MLKFHSELEGPPCKRMEDLLQEVADGRATGFRRWFAVMHAARCYHCGTFLSRMQATVSALRESRRSDPDYATLERLRARAREL